MIAHMGDPARNAAGKPVLTPGEFRIMEVLWAREDASVADVVAALKRPKLAYTTVLTFLRQLEMKGVATHRTRGRTFVYRPVVARDQVRSGVMHAVTKAFFGGSAGDLVLHMVRSEHLDDEQKRRLRELLDTPRR